MPLVCLFAACLLVLSGCGDATEQAAPVTGASGAVEQSATPPTAAGDGSGDDGGVGTGANGAGAADPDAAADSTQGDEEGARTPVEITISGGGFGSATPNRVHVPSFIAIELDVTVKDARGYKVTVVRDGKRSEHAVSGGGRSSVMLEGLRPNRSLTVKLGGDTVDVTADAEPGP